MRSAVALVFLIATDAALAGSQGTIPLPEPRGLDRSVGSVLRARRSTRKFEPGRRLTRDQLGTILWAMSGVNRPDPSHPGGGKRTAPSAYGSNAVDVLVTSSEGTFLYSPKDHALVRHSSRGDKDLRAQLAGAAWASEAPVLVLLVTNLDRYPERVAVAERRDYSFADAAVIAQNLYLACAGLDLGTVLTVNAKRSSAEILGLSEDQDLLFVLPVGYPRPDPKSASR